MFFASDNAGPAHPKVMEALMRASPEAVGREQLVRNSLRERTGKSQALPP